MYVLVSYFQELLSYAVHVAHHLFLRSETLDNRAELDNLVAVSTRHDNVHVPFVGLDRRSGGGQNRAGIGAEHDVPHRVSQCMHYSATVQGKPHTSHLETDCGEPRVYATTHHGRSHYSPSDMTQARHLAQRTERYLDHNHRPPRGQKHRDMIGTG